MKRTLVKTADGSNTLYLASLDEHYHSIHGALQESRWVFIDAGLHYFPATQSLNILEVGFGTGLNALLTLIEQEKRSGAVTYHTLEAYPLSPEEYRSLDYPSLLEGAISQEVFQQLHEHAWETTVEMNAGFLLKKLKSDLTEITLEDEYYNLIYFDAFAPDAQPELWTEAIFEKLFRSLRPGGILVTYCAKGYVKRNMKAVGFEIERLPGPKGKREMTRAIRPGTLSVKRNT